MEKNDKTELRVWWIPQVPGKAFGVEVDSLKEGVKLMATLADYDWFQYAQGIKPDYCNSGGIEMLVNGEWEDWYDEESGEDNPELYLSQL